MERLSEIRLPHSSFNVTESDGSVVCTVTNIARGPWQVCRSNNGADCTTFRLYHSSGVTCIPDEWIQKNVSLPLRVGDCEIGLEGCYAHVTVKVGKNYNKTRRSACVEIDVCYRDDIYPLKSPHLLAEEFFEYDFIDDIRLNGLNSVFDSPNYECAMGVIH